MSQRGTKIEKSIRSIAKTDLRLGIGGRTFRHFQLYSGLQLSYIAEELALYS
jgi:hypothetical protein